MTDPATLKAIAIIGAWYAEQRWKWKPGRDQRGGLMLGAVIWGRWYLDVFTDYGLPTILAPENVAALQDSTIALYTDEAGRERLEVTMMAARDAGIDVELHTLPAEIIAAHERPFLPLAAAQQLLVTRAARAGMAFHQLAPDHEYSARYFPNLKRLGRIHRNIAHGGLNVACPPIRALEAYRSADGSLAIPARALATIGWDHATMCPMNGTSPDRMPDEHYQVSRARDRVMLFNCYANPAYMPPEVCKKLDVPNMTTGTLDCHTMGLFRGDFYVPGVEDDMGFLSLGNAVQGTGRAANYTTLDAFLARMWREIGGQPELLAYYLRPTEMAAEIDETAPTAETVMAQQAAQVDMAVERARRAA
jgi:hypothetical protein